MIISRKNIYKLWLILIVALASALRIQGINWDSGFHFHPDERMLIMVTEKIEFFSNLNPDFFNYGSLPIYILAGIAQLLDSVFKTHFDSYDGLLILGRLVSTFMDLVTIVVLFRIAELMFKSKSVALWSAFLYAVAFFPIQNSHFFIVDTFLNLFATILIFLILRYRTEHIPKLKYIGLIGIVFAACLTSKVTALLFTPIILLAIILPHPTRENLFQRIWSAIRQSIPFYSKDVFMLSNPFLQVVIRLSILSLSSLTFAFLFMPYAFLNSEKFLREILLQMQMNNNPYIFPYTLQYVGTTPYLYYLKNIFLWGLGPIISVFALIGILIVIFQGIRQIVSYKLPATSYQLLFALFYLLFFIVMGRSSVKFMRYMLLMYPFFAIMAGYAVTNILRLIEEAFENKPRYFTLYALFFGMLPLLWTLMFLSIYTRESTRIQATEWINRNIEAGKTLAVEHWDDRVPIFDPGIYQYEELTIYDIPDNAYKWDILNEKLARSDYIVIASNRLYTPLQRLQDCDDHGRCYPMTKIYYEKLFSGELGFKKVAEFTAYPQLSIFNYQLSIIDDGADESFTVYDHPKIMIFEKIR
ncbi:glycosyltransferase family 39 protein [Candidatus Woesebacteria bacterium]|nr:glycosyltransferase family 39 protein [Candidatus Woesebacteria bacterium]